MTKACAPPSLGTPTIGVQRTKLPSTGLERAPVPVLCAVGPLNRSGNQKGALQRPIRDGEQIPGQDARDWGQDSRWLVQGLSAVQPNRIESVRTCLQRRSVTNNSCRSLLERSSVSSV